MKKLYLVVIQLLVSLFCYSQNGTSPFLEITDSQGNTDVLIDCDYPLDSNRCFNLEADYTTIYETTEYQVESIPYTTLTGLTNETIVTVSGDDKWSEVLQLPFDFCFYNEGHDEFILGDNGIISFNTSLALADCQYLAGVIPNGSMPTDAIFGVFHDLTNDTNVFGCTDDPSTPENECGEIKTYVIGTAPQRAFVISYENLNHFNCETSRSTSQIVLYESTNIIDVYVQDKPINCEANPTNYRKNALIGIQNQDGTEALAPPGRNSSIWSTSNEAWRFTPNGIPVTVVEWQDENGVTIATGDQILVCPEETTSYTASVTYDFCNGTSLTLSDDINITIDTDFPIAIDNDIIICDIGTVGEEIINLTDYDGQMVGAQTGLVLSYYNSLADAQTATNPIADPTTFLMNSPTDTIYVRLQRGVGCFDVGQLTLNLETLGTSQLANISVCDVDNDNSELIDLTGYTSQITGTQTNVNIAYYETLANAQGNIDPITEITAANGDSVFVNLTLQPDDSCPNIEEIPINLLTVPTVSPIDITLCSNILVYDLTQHEADVQTNNTETLTFSYHYYETWAINNINPILDPDDTENYVLNSVNSIWVRTENTNGCVEVFPLNFTYINGVTVQNDSQASLGNVFDLTTSIADMVADLTGISVEYYDSEIGAQTLDPASLIADPTNYQILNPEAEVFIVFTNTASGCSTIGTLELETVGFGGAPNGNALVCDTSNDSEEFITLSNYSDGIVAGYDNSDYMEVTYHPTMLDATNNINPITTMNITGPTTVYARIALVFEGVEIDFQVEEITLNFQPTTELDPVTVTICDEFENNYEYYDLTLHEDEISMEPGVVFAYQYTWGGSIGNPENFYVSGVPRTVNVLVTTTDGCTSLTTLTIDFYPDIVAVNSVLQGCDVENDGEHTFNLNDVLPDVSPDYALYEATYYATVAEANTGLVSDQLPNPTAFTTTTTNTYIFLRLYNPTTMCYNTAQIQLQIIPTPQQLASAIDVCDFENDGTETNVDLSQFDNTIVGSQPNVNVIYYATQTDADNDQNPITTVDITTTETVYISLNAPANCIITGVLDLNLIDSPVVNNASIIVCDNFTDGEEIYDLTQHNDEFVADTSGLSFQYFTDETNALDNVSVVNSSAYNITSVPQVLYVRITNTSTGCFSIAEMDLDFTFPVAVLDAELSACDDDFNLSEEFDLTTAIPAMLADTTGLDITYYSEQTAAETADATFEITTPETHNTANETDNVFVRFYDAATGCFSVGRIELEVLATPKLVDGSYEICDTDFDGEYTLGLSELNPIIIQNTSNLDFTYFTDFSDAENQVNAITNNSNYVVPNNNHTVYIRVENLSGCWSVAAVTIGIRDSAIANPVTDILEACDDDNDTFGIFDLTTFESQITSETGATFTYYNSQSDAELQQNVITNPTAHQNVTPNTQTVFVRVAVPDKCDNLTSFDIQTIYITPPTLTEAVFCAGEDVTLDVGANYVSYLWNTTETTQTITVDTAGTYSVTLVDSNGCTGTFDVVVTELPLPTVVPTEVTECDYTGNPDGFMQFDLNTYNNQLTNNNTNVTTTFYLNQTDFDSDTALNPLFTNTSNPQTLLVKVEDNVTGCFDQTTLTLNTSFIELTPNTYEICDIDFDGNYVFNLTELNPLVIASTTAMTFSYFTNLSNAESNTDAITDFDYTLPNDNHTIFVRVENTLGCAYVTTVDVSYRANAIANPVTDILQACDDDNDTFEMFDITVFESQITSEAGATFTYYNSQIDAELQQNVITNPTAHQNVTPNMQTIFVRVAAPDKCDNITSFDIQTIYITPPTLTEAVFCAGEDVTLDVGSNYTSYLWNTSATTQAITVDTAGTYSVTLVDSNGCTGTFDVVVTELPLPVVMPVEVSECDYSGNPDGFTQFNLNDYVAQLTNNATGVTTSFYLNQTDFDNGDALNPLFTNTSNPQTLLVKVEDDVTGCFDQTTLTLTTDYLNLNPALLELCDEVDSEDGINIFDLSEATPQVLAGIVPAPPISYFATLEDAELQQNELPLSYTNTEAYSQTLFARVEGANGCVFYETVLLVVNDLPNLDDDNEVIYCTNDYPDTITLEAGILGDSPSNYYYLWNTGETTSTIQINEIGTYTVTATSTSNCSKTRTITVVPSNMATIESIEISDALDVNTVTVYISGEGDYEYAIDDEFGIYQDSNVFTNVEGGFHTLYVRDKNGCGIISETIAVISVPKFFTPNGDMVNPTWIPKGLSQDFQTNATIRIFNRYGKLLKVLDPFGSGWDGNYNGEILPSDDYWYTIEYTETFSGKQRQLTGHFALVR